MNSNRFVVTPTRGYSQELEDLSETVRAAGAQHIIIHPNPAAPVGLPTPKSSAHAQTLSPEFDLPESINIVRDAQNFQRWGNLGFKRALELVGEDAVVLMINDDISTSPETLNAMFEALEAGAHVVSMDDLPWAWAASRMTGYMFGVRPAAILMDEQYTYWHGEDDLSRRAYAAGLTTVYISGDYVHDRKGRAPTDTMFLAPIEMDKRRFKKLWG